MKEEVEYKFYNSELKIQYIEEKSKEVIISNNYLECQFNKTCKFEEELNKDLSNFTVYEIVEYYKMLNISSFDTLFVISSGLNLDNSQKSFPFNPSNNPSKTNWSLGLGN